jgi:hypothetical protein
MNGKQPEMNEAERKSGKPDEVNPDELGPGQPRDVDQPGEAPLRPDRKDVGKPFGTPDRPAPDQPELPSTGVP